MRASFASHWAILGIAALLIEAIWRLGRVAFATIERGLEPLEWTSLVGGVLVMGYGEGYRALHRRWVPSVVARARVLRDSPTPLFSVLAPLFALSLFGASTQRALRAWLAVGLVALAVLIVRALPDPWRGIVDGAVTVALMIGLASLLGAWFNGPSSAPSDQLRG